MDVHEDTLQGLQESLEYIKGDKAKGKSSKFISLYHGNADPNFMPIFGGGRDYHDYGNAFYCTEDFESAAEWACLSTMNSTSYVYEYDLKIPIDISPEIKILNFDDFEPIYWLSVLLKHRVADDEAYQAELRDRCNAFIDKYPIDCNDFDIIHGWRADDRHFAIIRDFLNTLTTLETTEKAILLGDLGKQFVIKSERAFTWLDDIKNPVKKTVLSGDTYKMWHNRYKEKDAKGRADYDVLSNEARELQKDKKTRGKTILHILEWL